MQANYHFILIDDNNLDLFINEKTLIKSGIAASVVCFNSADDCLSYLSIKNEQIPESIILLDLHMPIMNGFDFAIAFGKLKHHIKVKFKIYTLSSTVDIDDIEKVRLSPIIKDIIPKPIDTEELRKTLSQI